MHNIKSISVFATLLCLALTILSLNIISYFPESSSSPSSSENLELFPESQTIKSTPTPQTVDPAPQTINPTPQTINPTPQTTSPFPESTKPLSEPTEPLPILPLTFNSSSIESISSLSPQYTFLQTLTTSKNLIFIGDVHGALSELKSLLTLIEYDPTKDHLVFLGDLVAKGPSSLEVIEYVRKLSEKGEISCVRGNHDDKLLRWKIFLEALDAKGILLDDYVSEYELPKHLKLDNEHVILARDMSDELYGFLLSCPIVIEVPEQDLYAVHAGLLPDMPLNEQDPNDIMTMRSITSDGLPTKSKKHGEPWFELWNLFQSRSSTPKYIVYGHYASRGLTIEEYSFGLDSECVEGGKLTALMWSEGRVTKSVDCLNYLN